MSRSSNGRAIWQAYSDVGALDIACPHCGAQPKQWCTRDDGRVRRIPCIERATSTAVVDAPQSRYIRDFSEPAHPPTIE